MYVKILFLLFLLFGLTSVFGQSKTTFTTAESTSFTVPSGITGVTLEAWGGGAGGGSNATGGGGGGGAYASGFVNVNSGSSQKVTVGAGGSANSSGGNSVFGSNLIIAAGASGQTGGAINSSTGTIKFAGGDGGSAGGSSGGGGGGSAFPTAIGNNGATGSGNSNAAGGTGAGAGGTGGGNGETGGNGVVPGGGGGGGNKASGGNGASGRVIVAYYLLASTSTTSSICVDNNLTITISGSAESLPVGSYTVTYDLSAPNASENNSTTMMVTTAGTATFTTVALNNVGPTTITITSITATMEGLVYKTTYDGTGNANNKATITVSPISVGGIAVATTSTVCSGSGTTISLTGSTGTIQWQQSADGNTGWSTVTGGSGGTTASYKTPNLYTTTYYRALVTSGACTSAISTAATIMVSSIPASPGIITGLAAQCVGATTQIFSIAAVANATNYSWSVPAGTGWSITKGQGTNTIEVTVGTGSGNISVNVVNACGIGYASGDNGYKYVTVVSAPAAPESPRADSPNCTGFTVRWAYTANATKYYLDVSINSDFSTFVSVYNKLDVGNVLNHVLTGLNPGTTYYYRVRANNSCGTGPSSSTMSFATSPIPTTAPVVTNAADIICDSAQLNWNIVDNTTGLYLDIATDANFTEYVGIYHDYNVGYNNGSFYVSNLPSGDLYYRVRAYNSCATTGYSNTGIFRTTAPLGGSVSPAQTICSGTSPTTNLTLSGYATANTKILKWQKASDAAFTTNVSDIAETTNVLTVSKMGAITANTYFRAQVQNQFGSWCSSYSSPVLITFNNSGTPGVAPSTPGAISGKVLQFPGVVDQVYSIAAVDNTTTYNWTVPTGWIITAGAGSTSIVVTTGSAAQNGKISVSALNNCVSSISAATLPVAVTVDLKSLINFTLFTSEGAVSNTAVSNVEGSVGTNVGAVTGFESPSVVNGSIEIANNVTAQAVLDLKEICNQITNTVTTNSTSGARAMGTGETLYPGVYFIGGAASIGGTLILDAQGDPNAQFIFKIGGAFTTGAGTNVVLLNGASPANIFWMANGAIAMAASTTISGNLISNPGAVSMGAGGQLSGRMLSTSGAVSIYGTLAANTSINKWKGSVSTNWNNANNWTQNFVPAVDASIVFDDVPLNNLVLDQNRSVTNILNTQSTYKVVCNGKILTIKGNTLFTNGAQIDASATGSVMEFAGSITQSITSGSFFNDQVFNLTVNNANNVAVNGNLRILNILNVSSGRLDGISNLPTIIYGGSSAQTIESNQYLNEKIFNLNIDNANGVTLKTNFALANNLTINSAKKFIIDAAQSLTVTGSITNNAGTIGLVLKSTAAGTASLIHNTNNVPATVQRYISGAKEAWHFLSAPVSNQTIAGSSFTPSGTYGNGTGYDLYLWNEPTPCWVYHKNDEGGLTVDPKNPKWPAVHSSTNFIPGHGYLYSVQATNPTAEFAGNLNNGSITYSITNSILGEDPNVRGFNLIGNPYPSSIDWLATSGWTRDALLVSGGGGFDMWIWNPVTSNYGVYNSLTSIGTNGVTQNIAPMQGFFVRAATNGTVTMTNSIRGNSGANNWMRMKTTKAEIIKVQIASKEDNGSDEILLQFGAPSNEAGAAKLFSTVTTAPSLFLNHEKKELSVLNLTDIIENASVPLMFKAGKDGNYALSIGSESASYDVLLLEDKKTKTITDLNTNGTYQFNGSVKDAADRFVLHFVPIIPEVVHLPATIYYDGNEINVDLTLVEGQTDIKVYDMLGRLLVDKKVEGKMIHSFAIKVKNEVYIVLANSKGKSISRKVLVY
ncbi:ice-binding family protein [Flavobacterium hiemivividum]|uniref:DUF3494 domain-containing protein n=1 Tax=Flavobacterium hiemivividum TaxID=2541734 RepID=A0A4R5CNG4_9FLAO|nr:ice-binding family protein [Flavobacterium hiemivividum]TDE01586.1 DUF3494 domain-containing protein [Flavobacterium hiemivividum]